MTSAQATAKGKPPRNYESFRLKCIDGSHVFVRVLRAMAVLHVNSMQFCTMARVWNFNANRRAQEKGVDEGAWPGRVRPDRPAIPYHAEPGGFPRGLSPQAHGRPAR